MQKVSLAQQLFDECDNRSNKKLAMIANIYVNHQTELQDYVTNIALIFFFGKNRHITTVCIKAIKQSFFEITNNLIQSAIDRTNLFSYSRLAKTNEIC